MLKGKPNAATTNTCHTVTMQNISVKFTDTEKQCRCHKFFSNKLRFIYVTLSNALSSQYFFYIVNVKYQRTLSWWAKRK